MSTRRVHLRSPGVKTGSTIGPLGPFRGTLGIHWVIGAIAVGLVLVLMGSWFFLREPPPPFEPVESITFEQLEPGVPTEVFAGVYVAKTAEDRAFAVAEPENCDLEILPDGYVDCADRRYGLDGVGNKSSLARLPLQIHHGAIYIDTSSLG